MTQMPYMPRTPLRDAELARILFDLGWTIDSPGESWITPDDRQVCGSEALEYATRILFVRYPWVREMLDYLD